jgi:hypothetical protein
MKGQICQALQLSSGVRASGHHCGYRPIGLSDPRVAATDIFCLGGTLMKGI